MSKIKVIQIAHASHSYFSDRKDDLKAITLNDWYFKTAVQLKKFYPKIEIECWAPEKEWKDSKEYKERGIKIKFFPTTFSPRYGLDFSIPMLKEIKKEIEKSKRKKYKLILHLHEYHNLHGIIIPFLFGKEKIIAQHHGGSWPLKHLSEKKGYRKFFPFFILGQIIENLILERIKVFYALSKTEIDYLKYICPNSKIVFQTMGVEEEYFEIIPKKSARKKLGFPLNKKIILFIGRVAEEKGIKYLLDVMREIEKYNDKIELKIIGYGKEREKFEEYSKKLGLKRTEFLGGKFGEEKRLYLSAADCLVLPSLKEGAPVTIMEAMAKNLPSVVTNVGGVELMIENKKNGIIVTPKNTNELVKAVKEILKWKSIKIQNYAERYKWKGIIKNTVKDYEEI